MPFCGPVCPAVGLKTIGIVADCPAASVTGYAGCGVPRTKALEPLSVAPETVIVPMPVFDTTMFCVRWKPTSARACCAKVDRRAVEREDRRRREGEPEAAFEVIAVPLPLMMMAVPAVPAEFSMAVV